MRASEIYIWINDNQVDKLVDNDKLTTKYFVVKLWVSNVYSMNDWLIE